MTLRPRRPSSATVIASLALTVALTGGTALAAATGYVRLGKGNTEQSATTLNRTSAGPALSITVKKGSAPLGVNSTQKVSNLNADLVDGQHASNFQPKLGALTFTPLTLENGWTGNCYFGGNPAVAVTSDDVVRLRGTICNTDKNPDFDILVLPKRYRPSSDEYLVVDQCGGLTGRLAVQTDGTVSVIEDPNGSNSPATCFTSLQGVTYSLPY